MRILLVGGGAREHAIAEALCKHPGVQLFSVMSNRNPGISDLSRGSLIHDEKDVQPIVSWARSQSVEFAVVGFEEPLMAGLCDELEEAGIPSLGPKKAAAQLEGSKLFARELLKKHEVPGQVEYHHFDRTASVRKFLLSTEKEFAIKPIGLSAGKGVRVMGDQLKSKEEAIAYACNVIETAVGGCRAVLLEERLLGEEFTLQCFVDGKTVAPMPAVQDYKRAYDGNRGPNTGGMGSYTHESGLLPFLAKADYEFAVRSIREAVAAMHAEGREYKGVLYGQFMLTATGPRLIEFNARFGDPEAMNVLALLETDFVSICEAVFTGTLDRITPRFSSQATVCKYIVPRGYGVDPKAGTSLKVDFSKAADPGIKLYYAKVDREGDRILTTKSRSIAILGVGNTIDVAEARAERGLACVEGEFDVRHDIGRIRPSSKPMFDPTGISARASQ